MRTLTEKYNGVLKGLMNEQQFLRDARMEFPTLVTVHNSFKDAVRILQSKGIIGEQFEEKDSVEVKEEVDPELLDLAQTAMRISKEEGVVQHVNQNPDGKGYHISDWFDADNTIISFEDGRKLNETSNPCWKGYEMVGTKKKGGKEVPNCVPISENRQQLQRNDIVRHIPTGVEMRVSVVKPTAVSGVIIKAGNLSSKFRVGDVTQFKNVLLGVTWEKVNESLQEEYEAPKPHLPLDVLDHGIRFELDKQGLGTDCTVKQYEKAKTKATKNLEKDLLFYKREEGAKDMPVSKTDQMVKVKLKEGIKTLIKKILSEDVAPKRTFTKTGRIK